MNSMASEEDVHRDPKHRQEVETCSLGTINSSLYEKFSS